jgi:hypothetical protein
MAKKDKTEPITREWVQLQIQGSLSSYVTWKQFAVFLTIIAGALGFLYDKIIDLYSSL